MTPTLDDVMALADDYADELDAFGADQPTIDAARAKLRAAIEKYARGDAEPVAWIADWQFEHLVSGSAAKGPIMQWPDPQDRTGLVPLFTRPFRPPEGDAKPTCWLNGGRCLAGCAGKPSCAANDTVAVRPSRPLIDSARKP